jgi:hypothetical protein
MQRRDVRNARVVGLKLREFDDLCGYQVRAAALVHLKRSDPAPISTCRELWGKACTQPNAKK